MTTVVLGKKMVSKFKQQKELINKLSKDRLAICRDCPSFNKLRICNECKCIMPLKVKIPNAKCPLGKW